MECDHVFSAANLMKRGAEKKLIPFKYCILCKHVVETAGEPIEEPENRADEWMAQDVMDLIETKTMAKYTANYDPDSFWHDMGKIFIDRFWTQEEAEMNLNQLLPRIMQCKPESVLEIGCGFGRILKKLAYPPFDIQRLVGIDLSETMIENGKKYLNDELKTGKVDIYQQNISESLRGMRPTPKIEQLGWFDLVFSHSCLLHIPPAKIGQVCSNIDWLARKWIIHFERFRFPYEHPRQHRWSHDLAPHYLQLGWTIWEYAMVNEKTYTTALVLKKQEQ